jgi:hypothetical protein
MRREHLPIPRGFFRRKKSWFEMASSAGDPGFSRREGVRQLIGRRLVRTDCVSGPVGGQAEADSSVQTYLESHDPLAAKPQCGRDSDGNLGPPEGPSHHHKLVKRYNAVHCIYLGVQDSLPVTRQRNHRGRIDGILRPNGRVASNQSSAIDVKKGNGRLKKHRTMVPWTFSIPES